MLNLAMSTGDAEECYYLVDGKKPGGALLGSQGEDRGVTSVSLVDRYLSTRIDLGLDGAARVLRFPVVTVSMSEAGFEKSYQSSVIVPLWEVQLRPGERMITRIEAAISVLQPAVEEIQDRG
jgi:alpha-amylase